MYKKVIVIGSGIRAWVYGMAMWVITVRCMLDWSCHLALRLGIRDLIYSKCIKRLEKKHMVFIVYMWEEWFAPCLHMITSNLWWSLHLIVRFSRNKQNWWKTPKNTHPHSVPHSWEKHDKVLFLAILSVYMFMGDVVCAMFSSCQVQTCGTV